MHRSLRYLSPRCRGDAVTSLHALAEAPRALRAGKSNRARWPDAVIALHAIAQTKTSRQTLRKQYDKAIHACGHRDWRDWQMALTLLNDMEHVHAIKPTAKIFAEVICVCAKASAWEHALDLLTRHLLPGAPETPSITNNRFVLLAASAVISAMPDWQRGWRIYQQLQHDADTALVNAMITSCARAAPVPEWERACLLLDGMIRNHDERKRIKADNDGCSPGCSPDVISFSAAISACEKAGEWRAALAVLDTLLGAKFAHVQRDRIVFSAAISACEKAQQWQHALRIFDSIDNPDVICFNSALSALAHCSEESDSIWRHTLALFGRIMDGGGATANIRPDHQSYTAVMEACGRSESAWARALHIFRAFLTTHSMNTCGGVGLHTFVVTSPMVDAVLRAYATGRQGDSALSVLRWGEMAHGVVPTGRSVEFVLQAYLRAQNIHAAHAIYNGACGPRHTKCIVHWSNRILVGDSNSMSSSGGACVDFHGYHRYTAMVAMWDMMTTLRNRMRGQTPRGVVLPVDRDVVIVVGKGLHSRLHDRIRHRHTRVDANLERLHALDETSTMAEGRIAEPEEGSILKDALLRMCATHFQPPLDAAQAPYNAGCMVVSIASIARWARER
eukprot:GEMP01034982.1.p1 GENE.GEMP01034982.1~~GEMP01034982.1.p1  ORF type:complete len:619 (+),score=163.74 GEMP01034982.1:128-1984(+)